MFHLYDLAQDEKRKCVTSFHACRKLFSCLCRMNLLDHFFSSQCNLNVSRLPLSSLELMGCVCMCVCMNNLEIRQQPCRYFQQFSSHIAAVKSIQGSPLSHMSRKMFSLVYLSRLCTFVGSVSKLGCNYTKSYVETHWSS